MQYNIQPLSTTIPCIFWLTQNYSLYWASKISPAPSSLQLLHHQPFFTCSTLSENSLISAHEKFRQIVQSSCQQNAFSVIEVALTSLTGCTTHLGSLSETALSIFRKVTRVQASCMLCQVKRKVPTTIISEIMKEGKLTFLAAFLLPGNVCKNLFKNLNVNIFWWVTFKWIWNFTRFSVQRSQTEWYCFNSLGWTYGKP